MRRLLLPLMLAAAVPALAQAPGKPVIDMREKQKRAIFYDNAARFLRLTPEEIAKDHKR